MTRAADPNALPRVLGPWMAAAVVVGTVIGAGVFKKAKVVSESVPDSGVALLVWVLVGVLTVMGALAYAEVWRRWRRTCCCRRPSAARR